MTLVSTRGPVYFPAVDSMAANGGAPYSEAMLLMDATAEKVAYIFTAPKTGTLHKVRFRMGTVTTGDTLKISFQTVDPATGNPDGTADQFRTLVVGGGDDNVPLITGILSSDGTDGGTKRSVTRGEVLAIVIEFDSWVAGNMSIVTRNTQSGSVPSSGNYVDHFTASWAKQTSAPKFALEYSDGSYAPIPYVDPAVSGVGTESYNSGSTPDERGLFFQVPFSCKAGGVWVFSSLGGDADVVLYDSNGTSVLESVSLDKDLRQPTTGGVFHVYFATDVTLTPGVNYRLALKPTTVTTLELYSGSVPAAAVLDALPGGQQCHFTSRTDAGSWTETTTKCPLMGLILSALDDGAGAGGGGGGSLVNGGLVR